MDCLLFIGVQVGIPDVCELFGPVVAVVGVAIDGDTILGSLQRGSLTRQLNQAPVEFPEIIHQESCPVMLVLVAPRDNVDDHSIPWQEYEISCTPKHARVKSGLCNLFCFLS